MIYEVFSTLIRFSAILIGFYLFSNDIAAVAIFSLANVLLSITVLAMTVYVSINLDKKRLLKFTNE